MTDINKAIIDVIGDGKPHKNDAPQTPGFGKLCEKLPQRIEGYLSEIKSVKQKHHRFSFSVEIHDGQRVLTSDGFSCQCRLDIADRLEAIARVLRQLETDDEYGE